ncbi:YdiY family protein [uncultured Shewanella sp.]|uniref:DUF481 domain-containing protein n=1 Tax=uncultured Shewanella sp. TaxID=173975 RepID=UPI0026070D40|nr:DUF481 domain-containing protein [uncultured Shewanella sp.]
MFRAIVVVCTLGLPFFAQALVPPDFKEPPSDFTAEIEGGFQLNTGNTNTTSFNGRTKLVYDTTTAKQEATMKAYYAADSQSATSERYDLQLQSNYKLDSGYVFGRGDGTWDRFGSYTRIYTLSSGYGFDAVSNSKTKLSLEVGPGYRYNLAIATDSEPNPSANKDIILRSAAIFEFKMQEYTSLNAALTSEVGADNNTLGLDVSYKNTLFQDWAFTIGTVMKYTQIVPEGTKQTDTITTIGLLYTFQ